MSARLLEVAANSVASALAAQSGGAARVELCAALEEGGLTPSHATIAMVREQLRIPVHVLIRPRAGDFLYDALEREAMRRDIATCAALGCNGVVFGLLDADGRVDVEHGRPLVAAARGAGMEVTFHRAFDLARDPREALESVIALGCERVLTSGAQATAMAGMDLIRDLVVQAGRRIVVMPGSGITAANIAVLAAGTGAQEFHASAKHRHESRMRFRPRRLTDMQAGELATDADAVRGLVRALDDCADA